MANRQNRIRIILAFLTIYIVWGTPYQAIKFALETMPPFLMGASRYFLAGLLMCAWMLGRGVSWPSRTHMISTLLLGMLLIVVSSMSVVLAEKTVSSGMVSLLVAVVPIYVVLMQWLVSGLKPTLKVLLGLVVGVIGMIILLEPLSFSKGEAIDLCGAALVLVGGLGSAAGSLYCRVAKLPESPQLAAGMQMLFAGLILFVIAAFLGEFSFFQHFHVSLKSGLSWLYLVVFSSMLAFSAYVWLLKQVNPAHVSTYAVVNPVVAIFLGCSLAGEILKPQALVGTVVVLTGVWLITKTGGQAEPTLAVAGDATLIEAGALEPEKTE